MQQSEQQELLNEIFLTPSQQMISDRFAEQQTNAPCNGHCASGVCRTL